MTCADCGLTVSAMGDEGPLLSTEYKSIAETGRCVGCAREHYMKQRIRKIKGEVECQTKKD